MEHTTYLGLDYSEALDSLVMTEEREICEQFEKVSGVHFTLKFAEHEKPQCTVTCVVTFKGRVVVGKENNSDMYLAIKNAADKVRVQLSK